MKKLENKVAVITGGARGIGKAAAELFVREGAKVLLVDVLEKDLQQTVKEIGEEHASYEVADVSKAEDVQRYVQAAVQRYGGIDVFFNNAGIVGDLHTIIDCSEASFRQVFEVNVLGAWLGMKYIMPEMIKRGGGSIVNTASIAGLYGASNVSSYVMSKHAMMGLTKCAAMEGAPHNIRVNSINPGFINTDMMRDAEKTLSPENPKALQEHFAGQVPFKRYGEPQEVAKLVLFLASDDSSYTSGSAHVIDAAHTISYL